MTTYLLDVNVLIALVDPAHVHHEPAHAWFSQQGSTSWATCPMTENGLLRIVGHPRYPNSPGSPGAHSMQSPAASRLYISLHVSGGLPARSSGRQRGSVPDPTQFG